MTTGSPATTKVKTAVITGGHSFDVLSFHRLFRSMEGIDAYIQHMDDFASSPQEVRDGYDAVLFYGMPRETPSDKGPSYSGRQRSVLEHLGETEQGILVLHHAILAYPDWSTWDEIVGIQDRSFGYHDDQTIQIEVANPVHQITVGLTAWEMVDETYTMDDAGSDSDILLTVDHSKSMRTVGWTRCYKKARVFCYALGHGDAAWSDPNFRNVLTRGLQWVAGWT
jgi:hypothetical protein